MNSFRKIEFFVTDNPVKWEKVSTWNFAVDQADDVIPPVGTMVYLEGSFYDVTNVCRNYDAAIMWVFVKVHPSEYMKQLFSKP